MGQRFPVAAATLLATLVACQAPAPGPVGPSPAPSTAPPSPAPSSTPEPTPSATPTPSPTPDDGQASTLTLAGIVKNDQDRVLTGMTVTLEWQQDGKIISRQVTTDGLGKYRFETIPVATPLTLTALGTGYGSRQISLTLPTLPSGTTFTQDFTSNHALTDKPEIIASSIKYGEQNVPLNAAFEFTFSSPMDKASVLRSFALQLDASTPYNIPNGAKLIAGGFPPRTANTLLTADAFDVEWPSASKAIFRPRLPLPTSTTGTPPRLRIGFFFNGEPFTDTNGRKAREIREDSTTIGPFHLDGMGRPYLTFVPTAPSANLRLTEMVPTHDATGDKIKLIFSQPLYYTLADGSTVAAYSPDRAPAAAGAVTAAAAAANYQLKVNDGTYASLDDGVFAGVRADFDPTAPQHNVVILSAPPGTDLFERGDSVSIRIAAPIFDAFGNDLSLNDAANSSTSAAR